MGRGAIALLYSPRGIRPPPPETFIYFF